MMKNPYKSRDWRISVGVEWVLKDDVKATIPCERCNGHGESSGWGVCDYEDLRCKTCWGSGSVPNPELEPRPRMPEVFLNYMRGYFNKFFDDMDARREENEKV